MGQEPERLADVNAAVYTIAGPFPPFGSGAVAQAKSKFAEENDLDYRQVKGRLIGYNANDPMVVVCERPLSVGKLESKW